MTRLTTCLALTVLTACDSEPAPYPAVGIDVMRLQGGPAFERFAATANSSLDDMIDDGRLLLALELVELDDPADDPALTVAYYPCLDPDADPTDNFDADRPDTWEVDRTAPDTLFPASIRGGVLSASTPVGIAFPGLPIDIEVSHPTITGPVTEEGGVITSFGPGTLSGAVTASTLTGTPNLLEAFDCPGDTMLDVMALGCAGSVDASQPDVDVDGDGLEQFFDSCDPAVAPDGIVECCVDGDGAVIEGVGCTDDPRFADGFDIELLIHGTRIQLR